MRNLPRHAISLGVLGFVTLCPPTAVASDLSFINLIYQENFEGESTFPTTPEVDELALGGLTGEGGVGNAGPTLDGSVAIATATPLDFPVAAGVFADSVGTDSIGARGVFGSMLVDPGLRARASMQAAFFLNGEMDLLRLRLAVSLERDLAGNNEAEFCLTEFVAGASFPGGAEVVGQSCTALATPAADAISNGTTFLIDLYIDRSLDTLTGSLQLFGLPDVDIGPYPIQLLLPSTDLTAVSQGLTHLATTSPLDVQIEFREFQLFGGFATSFTVDTTTDAVDANIGDGLCETAGGPCSLRAAIQESNAIPGTGRIIVPAGTHALSLAGTGEEAAATGDLDVTDDLLITGAGAEVTSIDAAGLDRVLHLPSPSNAQVDVVDLEIRGGSTNSLGGGILSDGTLRLANCRVADNVAHLAGGIMNRGLLFMDRCVVEGNEAFDFGLISTRVGGIASASTAAPGPNAQLIVRNSAIVNNIAPAWGGLEISNGLGADIQNTTIAGNSSAQIRIWSQDVNLDHVTIKGDGQGISGGSFDGSHTLSFNNTAIEGSTACSLGSLATVYAGHNASSDTSCGFVGGDDVTGMALGLSAVTELDGSRVVWPLPESPLIDAGDDGTCADVDQLFDPRPLDGDDAGGARCDIGAIEVPEPRAGMIIGCALLALIARRRLCAAIRTVEAGSGDPRVN